MTGRIERSTDADPVDDSAVEGSDLQPELQLHVDVRPVDRGGMILRHESGWQIQIGTKMFSLPGDHSAAGTASEFANAVKLVQGAEPRCVLGLASDEVFFADIDAPDSIDAKDRSVMIFELEHHFPLDAEAMVADYSIHPTTGRIAALAVQTDRLRSLVTALEDHGVEIVAMVPTSFLIARAVERGRGDRAEFMLLLFHGESSEQLTVDVDGVSTWRRFSGADPEINRHHAVTTAEGRLQKPMVVVGRREVSLENRHAIQWCDADALQLAAIGANLVLDGRWGRWLDLRRGELAPRDPLIAIAKPLRRSAFAAILCCVVVIGAAWFRRGRIEQESESIRQQQRAAYLDAFPGRRVPVMLMRSVRSEHASTLGSRGRGNAIPLPIPATIILRDVFRGLHHARQTADVRFRLIDLKIIDGQCTFTLRTTDAVHIGTISKSLEMIGFQVAPPASEQIDPSKDEPLPTYQSTITAVWRSPTLDPSGAMDTEGG